MRILHVTAQKPDSTGSGVYLNQTVAACRELGAEQAVICGVDASDTIHLPAGVKTYPVRFNTPHLPFDVCGMSDEMPYPSTRYRDMTPDMLMRFEESFVVALNKALGEFDPQIIVCNHLYLVTTLVREFVRDVPVVAICHNTCLRQLEQHNLQNCRVIQAVRKLDLILALHEGQRQRIVDMFGVEPERVRIIGTGYDAKTFFPCPAVEVRSAEAPEIDMVFAGKITYKKGVNSLISAVDALPCRPGVIHLALCGGVSNSFQQASIDILLKESRQNVRLLGKLAPVELANQFRKAQIFVLPSFYEGLPLVVVEALACGCKVVVTDLPGLRPWIEENIPNAPVWYVKPPRMQEVDEPLKRDLPAFEQRLAEAIREAILAAPKTVDCSHLSWSALGERLMGYCEELLQ